MSVYCVTGGTGLIAAYLVRSLLAKGHFIRTTVRDPENMEKVGFLMEMDGVKERLKIIKADLMIQGSFDEADGVFHVASPVHVPYDEYVQVNLIEPCIRGTLNVLNSCIKAKTVKRVVLTSSSAAIQYRDDAQEISPLNETHWSDPDYCIQNNLWYPYAKTTAEKEAWKLAKESDLDLVVVNPSFVVGPLLTPQPTSTLRVILGLIKGVVTRKDKI